MNGKLKRVAWKGLVLLTLGALCLYAPPAFAGDKDRNKDGGGSKGGGFKFEPVKPEMRQVRQDLKQDLRKANEQAKEAVREAATEVQRVKKDAASEIGALKQATKDKVNEVLRNADGNKHQAKEEAQRVVNQAKKEAEQIAKDARKEANEIKNDLKKELKELGQDVGKGGKGKGGEDGKGSEDDEDKDSGSEDSEVDSDAVAGGKKPGTASSGETEEGSKEGEGGKKEGGEDPSQELPPGVEVNANAEPQRAVKFGSLGGAPGIQRIKEASASGSAAVAPPVARLAGAREPEAVEAFLDKAILLSKSAATAEGRVASADAGVETSSSEAEADAEQAAAKLKAGDLDAAIKFATLALEKDPANVKALRALTDAWHRKGDLRRALEWADRWARLHPDHASAHHRRAALLDGLGERDAALEAFRVAAGLDPRLRALYEAAKRGGRIRYPDEEAEDLAAGESSGGARSWLLAAGAAGAAFLGLGLLAWRRRRGPGSAAPSAEPARSAFAGKFETVRVLERGPAGTLLEARDRKLERTVLVRRVPAGGAEQRAKAAEALRAAGSIRHRGLLDVYEVFEDEGDVCVVTELLGGSTAAAMLAQAGRFPLAQAVRLLEPVCEALEAAHARGVFHRRLSPESLLVTEQGSTKLRDLGLTPLDPPPPGDARRADVKALALTLYEMTAGAKPFADGRGYVPAAKRQPGLPAELDLLIQDALAPTPQPRVASAGEFLARLKGLGQPVGAS